jgi:uncharacterized protein YecA (UPF0149 family)
MELAFKEQVVSLIKTINIDVKEREAIQVEEERPWLILSSSDGTSTPTTKRSAPKIGRNDPCSCGSGKKYKLCGLIETKEHKDNMLKK